MEFSTVNFKLCIFERNLGCIRLVYDTMYCAVGEYRSSTFLQNACNTYCKTTKCRDRSNHKRYFQRSGDLESLLRIRTDSRKLKRWLRWGGHSSAGFHNLRLHSTRRDQLLEQMSKTQAETLNTAERHGICLRTETRRSASGKISRTSAFRVHKFEVDEILIIGGEGWGWKLRL